MRQFHIVTATAAAAAILVGPAVAIPSLPVAATQQQILPSSGVTVAELERAIIAAEGAVLERMDSGFLVRSPFGHPFAVRATECNDAGRCLFIQTLTFVPNPASRTLAEVNDYNVRSDSSSAAAIDADGDFVFKDTILVDGGVTPQHLANQLTFFSIGLRIFIDNYVASQPSKAVSWDGDRTADIGLSLDEIAQRDSALARALNRPGPKTPAIAVALERAYASTTVKLRAAVSRDADTDTGGATDAYPGAR